MNDPGQTFATVVHGLVGGKQNLIGPVPVAASVVFSNKGGKFVYYDGSRNLIICDNGSSALAGWADAQGFTASTTAAVTKVQLDISTESLYRIPVASGLTVDKTYRGKKVDLVVASDVQYAKIDETGEGFITIVDVDIANNCVVVRMTQPFQA